MIDEEGAPREEFLKGKLLFIGEENLQLSKDVFVNFCTPNIFTGGDLLREVHRIAGPQLEVECKRFSGLGSGECRLTDTYEATQFKKIANCILPAPRPLDKMDECDYYDFAMAYRNALDKTAESGFKSIIFPHPYFYSHKVTASIALATIQRWLNVSPYLEQLDQIVIMCTPELFDLYVSLMTGEEDFEGLMAEVFWDAVDHPSAPDYAEPINAKLLESVMLSADLDAITENPLPYNGTFPTTSQYCMERYGFDEAYIHENADQLYDELFKTSDGLQLQLSRNLSSTILTIEEGSGLLRQYRMTTQNREGDTCYFRCSRCESLLKHNNSEYRPKITVKNGYIFGDCYPEHHPQCFPVTKESVIIQQMDREARMFLFRPGWDCYDYSDGFKPEMIMDGYYPDMGVAEYGYNNSYGAPWQDGYIKQPYDEMDYQYDGENYPVADENSEIVDGGNVSKMTDVAPGDEDYQQQNSSYGKEPIQTSGYADNEYVEDLEKPGVGERDMTKKCRKYRIIRLRRRTNATFEWQNDERF